MSRLIKRIPTLQEQEAAATRATWHSTDKPSQAVLRELGRLGFDVASTDVVLPVDDDACAVRIYLTNVGARALNVVLRVTIDGRIVRLAIGPESFTARQALPWLRKRAARERKYLP